VHAGRRTDSRLAPRCSPDDALVVKQPHAGAAGAAVVHDHTPNDVANLKSGLQARSKPWVPLLLAPPLLLLLLLLARRALAELLLLLGLALLLGGRNGLLLLLRRHCSRCRLLLLLLLRRLWVVGRDEKLCGRRERGAHALGVVWVVSRQRRAVDGVVGDVELQLRDARRVNGCLWVGGRRARRGAAA
jgi:hypothetical protein